MGEPTNIVVVSSNHYPVIIKNSPILVQVNNARGAQGPAGKDGSGSGGGYYALTPAERAAAGEMVFVSGFGKAGDPNTPDDATQTAIQTLIAAGWPEYAIGWRWKGESTVNSEGAAIVTALRIDSKFTAPTIYSVNNAIASVLSMVMGYSIGSATIYGLTNGTAQVPSLTLQAARGDVQVYAIALAPDSTNANVPTFQVLGQLFEPYTSGTSNAIASVSGFNLRNALGLVGVNALDQAIVPVNTTAPVSARYLGASFGNVYVAEANKVVVPSMNIAAQFTEPPVDIHVPTALVEPVVLRLNASVADVTVNAIARTPQTAPASLTVASGSTRVAELSWPATFNATSYNIYWHQTAVTGAETEVALATGTSTSGKVTGITSNTVKFLDGSIYRVGMQFGVSAMNSTGAESTITKSVAQDLAGAEDPQLYSAVTGGQVTVQWYPMNAAESWTLYYKKDAMPTGAETGSGAASGKITGIPPNGYSNVSYTIYNGLTQGSTYYFRIAARTSVSESVLCTGGASAVAGAPVVAASAGVPVFNMTTLLTAPQVAITGYQSAAAAITARGVGLALDKTTTITAWNYSAPPQVTGVTAVGAPSPITVSWAAITSRTVTYNLYYNTANSLTGATKLTGITTTSKTINPAQGTYYLFVSATTTEGIEGPTSTAISAVAPDPNAVVYDISHFSSASWDGWVEGHDTNGWADTNTTPTTADAAPGTSPTGILQLNAAWDSEMNEYFNSWITKTLTVTNGTVSFWAKSVDGYPARLIFNDGYINHTFDITGTWVQYSFTISGATGAAKVVKLLHDIFSSTWTQLYPPTIFIDELKIPTIG